MSGPLEIGLKDELLFIKSLLIPSFDPDNELDSSKKRNEWMRQEAIKTNWNVIISSELIKRTGTIVTLEKAEKMLEKKAESQQGKSKLHPFIYVVHHLVLLSFPVLSYCIYLMLLIGLVSSYDFFRWFTWWWG